MNMVNEGVLPPDELDDRDERREEQERARSRETVAEIVAAMRAMARVSETFVDRFSTPCLRTMMEMEAIMRRNLADRIEAAWNRERDEMLGALVRIGNWCAQDLCEDAYGGDTSGNYLKTLNGLCDICRPFMAAARKGEGDGSN